MANLLQLRSQVRSRLGVAATDNFVTDDIIDDHVNIAVQTIEAVAANGWPWQEVRGTAICDAAGEITLPANWSKTRGVVVFNQTIDYMPPLELEFLRQGTGRPSHYAILNRQMMFGPIPEAGTQVVHYYYKNPTYLSDDADVPEMPERYYPTIVAKAAELMSIREDDRASAQTHLAEYMQGIDRMKSENRTVSRGVGRRIRPGNWT